MFGKKSPTYIHTRECIIYFFNTFTLLGANIGNCI